jgi:4-amino-4-deoxy-L-arabinose transferase-like glycosyltransferase
MFWGRALQSNWRLRVVGIVLALGLALAARSVFTGQSFLFLHAEAWEPGQRQGVGMGLLLAALVCSVGVALLSVANAQESESDAGMYLPLDARRAIQQINWLGPALAACCYVASLGLYFAGGESLAVQLLWLAGLAILLISQHPLSAIRSDPQRVAWWEWWLITAITLIGFGLRYWRLTEIPSHVDNDVAVMGSYSLDMIRAGATKWFGMASSDHSLFSHQLLAWSMRLFGQNHYGLVMISVIAGTLTLPIVYLLGREMFGWKVGLIAMALLTISYTHIHFSRILFTPLSTFFVTLTFYFLFRGLRTWQRLWFALAGIILGLAQLVYYAGRVDPIIVLALLGWALLWERQAITAKLGHWITFASGALLSFGPMLAYVARNFGRYMGRGNIVGLFNPDVMTHSMNKYQVGTVGQVILEQVKRAFLTFHLYGDESPHFAYTGPMVSPLTATLLVLGLGICLVRLRSLRHFTLVCWIVFTLLLGGVLTADPPYWPHLAIVLPAVALVAALAAELTVKELARMSVRYGYWAAWLALAAAVIFTGVHNWLSYLDFVRDNALPRIRIARYLNSLPTGYRVRLVSDDWTWNEYAFRFFNQGIPGVSVKADQLQSTLAPLDKPTVFILYQHPELVPILQNEYPGGEVQEHLDFDQQVAFISYRFVPAGYVFPPAKPNSLDISKLPGWWLIGAMLAVWGFFLFQTWRCRNLVQVGP